MLGREPAMEYTVRARPRPRLEDGWDDGAWAGTAVLEVASFRPEGSDHRPRTRARLAYDDGGLSGLFHVQDRYVRSVHARFGEPVYRDSCVEIFLQPKPDKGYLNFEMNAGGTLLASHITDHRRTPDGFAAFTRLTEEDGSLVGVRSSLPRVVDPEVPDPLEWELAFFIPIALLEKYVGPIGPLPGQAWRANLYKCGDGTSHPHWASWSPVDALNFHLPGCFGTLVFEP
jgi:hypothetical protein